MSTIIIGNPQPFQPCKSDGLFFVVSADTATQPKFRYVYNVYVNGYNVFEGKSTPNPSGLGVLDISRVLNTYLLNYPISYNDTTPIFTHQTSVFSKPYSNEVVEYYIEVGEEYADSFIDNVTGFTGNGNQVGFPSVPSVTYKSFLSTMGVNRKANLQNFDIGQFTLSGSPSPSFPNTTDCLFLTNSPRIRDIAPNEYYTLSFTNYDLGGSYLSEPYYVEYSFYDKNGFLIRADKYANIQSNGGGPATGTTQDYINNSFTGGTAYNILNVGAGPLNIYDFPDDTDYYRIQLFGKASPVTPTPTPTITNTPTVTPTPGLTPSVTPTKTITPTPSSTQSAVICNCRDYEIINFGPSVWQVSYTSCEDGVTTINFYPEPYTTYNICACQGSVGFEFGATITVTDYGPCATPSPTVTPSSTPNVTPSSTPAVNSCVSGTTLNITDTGWIKYNDCNGNTQYVFVSTLGTYTITPCHNCNTILPGFPLADVANWNALSCGSNCAVPSVTPTPTPSVTPAGTQNVIVRDCCGTNVEYQVVASSSVNIGEVIVISNQCYQVVAFGGTGQDGNFTSSPIYITCNECNADYNCVTTATKPSVQKPSVEPNFYSPTGGTAPSITYTPVSEIFQFNIGEKCNYFLNSQIMFKNRYGAWDYFRFEKFRSEGLGINRQTYGQYNTTWGSSNPTKTTYSRGTTDYQTEILETHIVNSGFLNDPEFSWLEELYTTNDAYLIQENGTLFPINIVNAEFVRKTKGDRGITNIELTYTYSNNIKLLNN